MKKDIDIQGLIRMGITLAAIVGGYYYALGKIDSHIDSADIHRTTTELTEIFVLRREWQSNKDEIRDDMRYLRQKIDVIYNRLTTDKR